MGAMYHHVRRDICGEDGEMLIPMVVIWLRLFGANRDAEPIAELGEIVRKTNQATHVYLQDCPLNAIFPFSLICFSKCLCSR